MYQCLYGKNYIHICFCNAWLVFSYHCCCCWWWWSSVAIPIPILMSMLMAGSSVIGGVDDLIEASIYREKDRKKLWTKTKLLHIFNFIFNLLVNILKHVFSHPEQFTWWVRWLFICFSCPSVCLTYYIFAQFSN